MQPARLRQAVELAVAHGWLCPDPAAGDRGAAVVVHDLDAVDARLADLRRAAPDDALHAVAIKANPVGGVLDHLARQGVGLEAASKVELLLALRRLPPQRVVFDSPCKTFDDLRLALDRGVLLNLDSLAELDRVVRLLDGGRPPGPVGLRVNPDVGPGAIAATSTAMAGSKFGVELATERDRVIRAFQRWPWLTALHVHVGSQGCSRDQLVAGAQAITSLAGEVRAAGGRVDWLDVGGGLPVDADGVPPDFAAWGQALRDRVPALFQGPHRVVTEMGRSLHAQAGVVLSRVEAVKQSGGRRIAVLHVGADLFVRAAYAPNRWRHRLAVLDPRGIPKQGPRMPWDVVGPLCFSGDRLAKGAQLPPILPGDLVAVHDAGAYTLSMWSRYNSRQAPAVIGLRGERAELLKAAETVEQVAAFWGEGADPRP
ncbi:diaminopimelate decarboxylase [Myxococcota bacterium]|nr:diaminopimelate decarboxylase [Myxococcota bacterium]